MFLAPALGLVWAQEAPQQISSGFSCGPNIKGARREGGSSREAETQDKQMLAPICEGWEQDMEQSRARHVGGKEKKTIIWADWTRERMNEPIHWSSPSVIPHSCVLQVDLKHFLLIIYMVQFYPGLVRYTQWNINTKRTQLPRAAQLMFPVRI